MTFGVNRRPGIKATDHGEIGVERSVVTRNAGNGLLVERGALVTLEGTAVSDNGAEAVLHTPDTAGVRLVGDRNHVPPLMVRLGLRDRDGGAGTGTSEDQSIHREGEEEEEQEARGIERAETFDNRRRRAGDASVAVSIRTNIRRLKEGTELEEHLYGEAPDVLWFRSGDGWLALDDGDGDRDGVGDGDGDGSNDDEGGFWNVAEEEEP